MPRVTVDMLYTMCGFVEYPAALLDSCEEQIEWWRGKADEVGRYLSGI